VGETLMITNSNKVCFAKLAPRGLQEVFFLKIQPNNQEMLFEK